MKQQIVDFEKLKLAVDNAYDHVVITDPDGYILYANKAAERLTGYTFEEMKGRTPRLWGKQMNESFYQKFWRTIKNKKKFFVGEIKNKRKNGQIYSAEIRVSPVMDENRMVRFFVGIERDISKEKEIDQMKTEFISLTSHQLKTPLTVMQIFLEMLKQKRFGKLNPKQTGFVDKIQSASEEMIDLLETLLHIARLESGRRVVEVKPTSLGSLVQEVIDDLEEILTEKRQKLSLHVDPMPAVNIDASLLKQVYLNLINNAINYSREKGEITVTIKATPKEIISQVSDFGYGIPKNQQKMVFQKFFRASNTLKNGSKGTGLGLYLVKLIVSLFKGKIWFESREGQGTTFWFTLPKSSLKVRRSATVLRAKRGE